MSSYSDNGPCPNCQSEADKVLESRPFPHIEVTCVLCGFYSVAVCAQMPLGDLNLERAMRELPPLAELPSMDRDLLETMKQSRFQFREERE